jgi:polysaccharide chain length determinant protein (PEP-CTERM system associated)
MIEERSVHPLDYVSALRRRKWWLIVPVAASIPIGALLVLLLPRIYLSQATIGVAAPTLSPELLRGVGSLDREERQRAISQQLLSPTVLQRVVREEQINPGKPVDQVAGWLRGNVERNISVPSPIGRASDAKGLDAIILGYTDSDPERAQRIANRLANVFVEENSKKRIERSENTSEILGQQVRASQTRLTEIEKQLAEKKQRYMGRLPGQVDANMQRVNGLGSQLQYIATELRGEQDRLNMIESQIDQMAQGGRGEIVTASGAAAVQTGRRRISELEQELAQLRAAGWTDKHPGIVRLQEEIKQARAELTAQQTPTDRDALLKSDPIYQQKLRERDAARLRIRDLQRDSTRVSAEISNYQGRVDAAPVVEQELASLSREYEFEKLRYADLNTKHQQAQMAQDVTRKQGGERFSVLFPANRPTTPLSPKLPMVMLMSIAAGLVLGVGGALGREFLDRSVHDPRALQSEFEIPVLGEIPRITT